MSQDSKQLKELIDSIADQPYQKIQKLRGCFQFPHYIFQFIRIQGSPGANPASIAAVNINSDIAQFPSSFFDSYSSKLALADFLIRRFNQGINKLAQQNRGKEGSGSFHTLLLSQKMLERDCILLSLHGWVKTPSFSWLLLASHCILRKLQNIEKAVTQFFDFMYI